MSIEDVIQVAAENWVKEAVRAQRERDAQVCDRLAVEDENEGDLARARASRCCAAAIRAEAIERGEG